MAASPVGIGDNNIERLGERLLMVSNVIESIVKRLENLFGDRPLLFGRTPEGVDLLTDAYLEILAEAKDRKSEYWQLRSKMLANEECGGNDLSSTYREKNPNATDKDVASYVAKCWITVYENIKTF